MIAATQSRQPPLSREEDFNKEVFDMLRRSRNENEHLGPGGLGPARRLHRRDRAAIKDHLTKLGPEGRRLRFFGQISDAAIDAHVTRLNWRDAVLVGRYDGDHLVALAELIQTLPRWVRNAELAVSVSRDWRGQGIGADLLAQSLAMAEARRLRRVTLLIEPDNTAMLHLVRGQGAQICWMPGLVVARFRMTYPPRPVLQRLWSALALLVPARMGGSHDTA